MKLGELVRTSRLVGETRSRKAKVEHLAGLLRELAGEDRPVAVAFLAGELRQGRIGVGWRLLRDARPEAAAAQPALTLADVDRALSEVAEASGPGSRARRVALLRALLERGTPDEQSFLERLLVGELRQGALEGLLLEGVAAASELPAARVRRAAMLGGSLRDVATAVLAEGEAGLAGFRAEVLRPLQPMLAQPGEGVAAVLERLGRAAFEWKLDGARLQVHKRGDEVRLFTRRLHDVTHAAPEVVEAVRGLDAEELVLDGEGLALAPDGRPHPFQVTLRRFGRKLDVEGLRAELPLTPFFFDLLFLDGDPLVDHPAEERWRALERVVPERLRVTRTVTDDPGDAEAFLAAALARGHEGVVAKSLDAPYEAGRRGGSWLKLKPTHTLDLVVLAAEWGSGRRSGRLSNLHLGARDPAGGFVMLGKTFKGMTDATLERQTEELLAIETRREGHVVHVRPERVVEVAFDGVQTSPQYPGGVALRFARLVRYRDDKPAAEADTLEAVRALAPGGAGGEAARGPGGSGRGGLR